VTIPPRPAVGRYAAAIALGAFLLFQVEPVMGKVILPWFGGSAAVWTTCVLFFQAWDWSFAYVVFALKTG
jgi:membrane protein implicated in regulation of membrane protease activity